MSSADRYFDHNATAPLSAAARDAWQETAEQFWHNPSSLYPDAARARRRIEDAREQLAELIGAEDPEEIVFTGGATEANNAVFADLARRFPKSRCAVSAIEHPSVLAPARLHFGERLDEIEVSSEGIIDLGQLQSILSDGQHCLVSVMAANNETGTLQPMSGLAELCATSDALLHSDAVQLVGKGLPLPEVDVLVASGHKFGAPKGVGFVRFSESANEIALQTGGPQEGGRRAGTEDLPAVAAMVAALDAWMDWSEQANYRDAFEAKISAQIPGAIALAASAQRLPNTSMLVMPHGKNLTWLTRLGRRGFSISTGSACSSGAENGSHVLAAMGIAPGEADRALRISSGHASTPRAWDELAAALIETAQELTEEAEGGKRRSSIDLRSLD